MDTPTAPIRSTPNCTTQRAAFRVPRTKLKLRLPSGKRTRSSYPSPKIHHSARIYHTQQMWEDVAWDRDRFYYFLDLPRELRDEIYEFAMVDLPTRFIFWDGMKLRKTTLYPKALPNLCFTNRQIYKEATIAYIRRTRFVFTGDELPSHAAFVQWLSQFPNNEAFAALRQLTYNDGFYRYSTESRRSRSNYPDGLISRCSGLQDLVFAVTEFNLVKEANEQDENIVDLDDVFAVRPRTNAEIMEDGAWEKLFANGNMRRLRIVFLRGHLYRTQDEESDSIYDNFIEILRDGFQRHKKAVDLSYSQGLHMDESEKVFAKSGIAM
ncbi:hypothetical protein BDV96DRAFT_606284 [Lophiotrema nucula]|uniref:F-box domain-containing protein n=1 Tax=Lophiotrema nucula TaxID=690887 RepID=A0A6A5YKV9_9PLEO|nr:hypothetical protein BDV96DRAFT_606284 [Lophiotrema nucula]